MFNKGEFDQFRLFARSFGTNKQTDIVLLCIIDGQYERSWKLFEKCLIYHQAHILAHSSCRVWYYYKTSKAAAGVVLPSGSYPSSLKLPCMVQ